KGMKVETIAAGFAAKEAVSKALGTGIRGFNLADIEILRDSLGKPIVNMLGHAGEISFSKGIVRFELSLSHSSTNAIAFVIAIGTEQTYNINQETE
ncbi:MAG TPA: DNA-binding protein, partial [Clostridiales bacterium UBA8960]|nr:DNA-binding protein [Clostridiales bacterium UBA8960]